MHSFAFLLVLSSLALLSSIFFQFRLSQFRARQFVAARVLEFPSTSQVSWATAQPAGKRRSMRWISILELERIVRENPDDLVVLDLRTDAQRDASPLPLTHVLPVSPHELPDILNWLPSSQCVVFCGASDSWISTIERSLSMSGSAPFYFLDVDFDHSEAA